MSRVKWCGSFKLANAAIVTIGRHKTKSSCFCKRGQSCQAATNGCMFCGKLLKINFAVGWVNRQLLNYGTDIKCTVQYT